MTVPDWQQRAIDERRKQLGVTDRDPGDEDDVERDDPRPDLIVGPTCGECGNDGVDTSGNLPCPGCGSRDRRMPRGWGEPVGRPVEDLSAVNVGIAVADEIERAMVAEAERLRAEDSRRRMGRPSNVYPLKTRGGH